MNLFTEKPTGHVDERLMIVSVAFLLICYNFVGIIFSIFMNKKIKLTIISYLLFVVNTFVAIFITFSYTLGNIVSFLIVFAIEMIYLKFSNRKITMEANYDDSISIKKMEEKL
jgi:hypothetical protein